MQKLRPTYDQKYTKYINQNILGPTKNARFFLGTTHSQNRQIVWDSVRKLAYDIRKKNFYNYLNHYRKSIDPTLNLHVHTHTRARLTTLFPGYPGKPVPEW